MRQPGIGSERHSRPFRLLIPPGHGRPTLLCLPRSASSAGGPNPLSRGRARGGSGELRRVLATDSEPDSDFRPTQAQAQAQATSRSS